MMKCRLTCNAVEEQNSGRLPESFIPSLSLSLSLSLSFFLSLSLSKSSNNLLKIADVIPST